MFDGSDWLSSSIIGRIRENLSVGRFFGDEEKGQKGKSLDILPSLSLRSPRKRKGRGFLPANSPALHGDGSGA